MLLRVLLQLRQLKQTESKGRRCMRGVLRCLLVRKDRHSRGKYGRWMMRIRPEARAPASKLGPIIPARQPEAQDLN